MADRRKGAGPASAGIVVFRRRPGAAAGPDGVEILLVHPGGPFWADKNTHGWSIPKGEFDPETESGEAAAVREFTEEIGRPPPDGPRLALRPFKAGRKRIEAWLVEGDLDAESIESNSFEMEWPPKSGRTQSFPEIDRAGWFSLVDAATKLHKGQLPLCRLIATAIIDGNQGTR
ncbi:MAG: NUDIX domain-containing protein [Acidimicrobiales bacterium]